MEDIKRILILDDHADLLDIVKEVLLYEHFEVKGTTRSAEVIPLAQTYQPDLIIIDCHLAGYDSASLCKAVKANVLLAHIPVIICSAYVANNTNIDACGCEAVIPKPYNLEDLIETINGLLVA